MFVLESARNGVLQNYTFDPVLRLASRTNELTGTTNDLGATFSCNPASQIVSTTRTGDAYAWTGHFKENKPGTPNGFNQLTTVGTKSLTHDARGNVTACGTRAFTYSSENLLLIAPNSTTLGYDPAMRLQQLTGASRTTKFGYDGLDRIAEYDGSDTLQRRYVHGPGVDDPIVWYEGSGTSDRRFLSSDERGSIISVTDGGGALLGINRYDEFGQPQSTNIGAFGFTGQAWMPQLGLYYYKARVYDPELGRFLQTDPIGYEGGMNLYAYVGNDPINATDPLGLLEPLAKWGWSCIGNCPEDSGYWNTGLGGLTGLGYEKSQPGSEPGTIDWVPANGSEVSKWFSDHNGVWVGSGNTLDTHRFVTNAQFAGSHNYDVRLPLCVCGPDTAFETMRDFSGPGAPYAIEGTREVTLVGGNRIRQTVDPKARIIVNEALPGHFFGGRVNISVLHSNGVSSVRIVGSGFGPNALLNQVLGPLLFTGLAYAAYLSLNPGAARPLP